MQLLEISNHLQIYGERNGDEIILFNKAETDIAFRRVKLTREEARTMKNLLGSLEVEEENEKNEKSA